VLNGDAMAKNNLAYLYEKGYGVQKSSAKAFGLYKAAAAEGIQEAQAGLERLTKKNSEKKRGGCFITSAVCRSFNKSDDCYELTMFRKFRDGWLLNQADGELLVKEYYIVAPLIVEHINLNSNSDEIYNGIWIHYLRPCLKYIELGENLRCKEKYIAMVNSLREKFL
ncbi:MAG: SEL1-like repeat protein, partial [Selenomonas sp.]|nr:SEL1-like repeat protein [Selenomonas sp.]